LSNELEADKELVAHVCSQLEKDGLVTKEKGKKTWTLVGVDAESATPVEDELPTNEVPNTVLRHALGVEFNKITDLVLTAVQKAQEASSESNAYKTQAEQYTDVMSQLRAVFDRLQEGPEQFHLHNPVIQEFARIAEWHPEAWNFTYPMNDRKIIDFLEHEMEVLQIREVAEDDNSYESTRKLMLLQGKMRVVENTLHAIKSYHGMSMKEAEIVHARLVKETGILQRKLDELREKRKLSLIPVSIRHAKVLGEYDQTDIIRKKIKDIYLAWTTLPNGRQIPIDDTV